MRHVFVAIVLVAACGGKSERVERDVCMDLFTRVKLTGMFGEQTRGSTALAFGLACPRFSEADKDCLGRAQTSDDVDRCRQAGVAILTKTEELEQLGKTGTGPDLDAGIVAAVCACHELACLVKVGESLGPQIEHAGKGKHASELATCLGPMIK